jgi:hypothetical protein
MPLHRVSIHANLPDTERFWVNCEDCPPSDAHLVVNIDTAIRAAIIHIMDAGGKKPEQIIGWKITPIHAGIENE